MKAERSDGVAATIGMTWSYLENRLLVICFLGIFTEYDRSTSSPYQITNQNTNQQIQKYHNPLLHIFVYD